MRLKFKHFIDQNNLFDNNQRILLAVSGGVDSMVMLNLFNECGYNFEVAHCNFELRDAESDGDEAFVKEAVTKLGKQLFVKHFKAKEFAKNNNISIQVAARELRYSWFNEICETHGFNSIAAAHNSNDVAETILINLSRGTGLKGLTGIKPKFNRIIRPLLFASRKDIEEYAALNSILYRTDSSNSDTKYSRNRIRKVIIPELEKLNPSVVASLYASAQTFSQAWEIIYEELSNFRTKVHTKAGNETRYSIELLVNYPHRQLFLAEELIELGFAPQTVNEIEKSLFSQPGKVFYAPNLELVRDREFLILSQRTTSKSNEIFIDEETHSIDEPLKLKIEKKAFSENFSIPTSSTIAALDWDNLKFPLTVRHWQSGDWFIPFGMKGKKKVSDFLTDLKIPIHKKDEVYVLESNGEIVWIVGYRIDNRYRITAKTQNLWIGKTTEDF